ncbi:MAG: homoserine dehydrogenase [gamma proteobacterium symbiont of Ctena orbiculata]|uniref:Homoserine dehydrogenase n=1 Tax=Candidatus Thiodiazotropha taylori TaxID=2792791 RepID=A0A944QU62_9GAMM|nr:homoserine dehydrogenase [Candidatus Thiodiazotropha taylori]PUB90696.1 MAG: homoserine dehydrogenase [gamma proteobacterium symbiont of Ctena orbiculata]MBT2988520.1 homoserine dehydrogenase [Candidatus Thiodiazotropha taylori]MBT2997518.1 homoserine dehydrogenase [Candidatus Thiodiazotropha taylori]MBT3001192.1 homoserine dehydrogenase [Candidatus Thiodiazotropha taylori]
MNPVKVGLLGLGTVGGGTLNVLTRNADEIARRAGRGIQITHAAAKQYDPSNLIGLEHVDVSDDAFTVVDNPELDIIIELIGGYSPARELVLKAIENGKHVVTANKALIAMHGNEIFEAAQKKGVMVAFEAAVAGGIPIIKAVREGLAANHIEWIAGIINGTGNFILTEMRDKGREFGDVLKEAQALGYAEADPTFDVEGIDAAHKLTILGSIAFGIPLQFEKTYTEGITKIEPQDVEYADQFGYRIKHLGITRKTEAGIEMRVHPTMIPQRRLIANVDGVMNAVLVKGDAVGPTLYYGAGAGSAPTASAVVADVVDVVRMLTTDPENHVPHLAFQPGKLVDLAILPIEEVETTFYLRMQVVDKPGVVAKIASILAESQISIEAIQQKEPAEGDNTVPLVMLTQKVIEKQLNKAISEIEQLDSVFGQVMRIRVERLDG